MSPLDPKSYLLCLAQIPGVGPATLNKLLLTFGSAKAAWTASAQQVAAAGFQNDVVKSWAATQVALDPTAEWSKLAEFQTTLLTPDDKTYPDMLREIVPMPPLLFVRGKVELLNTPCIAVVGTRKPTAYGTQVAETLVAELVQAGLTIVSGLAMGIDALAHETALRQHGKTIAVLGSGVDRITPQANFFLGEQILQEGALVSEFPLGSNSDPFHFPQRNRIVSGLSLGTLVIEAGDKSGTLITAACALEQNRDVFAIPGPITNHKSIGTHRLIQQGAKLVTSAQDILDELNLEQTTAIMTAKQELPQSPLEKAIYTLLMEDSQHLDQISRTLQKPIALISSTLTLMEMKGMVHSTRSGDYSIKR